MDHMGASCPWRPMTLGMDWFMAARVGAADGAAMEAVDSSRP
ncbi:hypothetical protein ACFYWH_40150 [Streptomyces sp. NPDC003737]